MNARNILYALAAALSMISCGKVEPDWQPSLFSEPVKLAPYLYETTFERYYPNTARNQFEHLDQTLLGGACSVVRNGNFIGRNLDYYYDETAEFVVHVPAAPGRYASIAVAGANVNLTPEMVDKGVKTPYLNTVPYFATDGINEKGLYASLNVVPTGDLGHTTGTRPGAETLWCSMVVRHVLDHCATAEEACRELQTKNIKMLALMGELHYLIADATDTYVVEIIDNKLVWGKCPENIMTNFYLLHDGLTPHACGVERYDILKEHYDEGATFEGMCALMQKVRYSLSYDLSQSPLWYSEYYGYKWKGKDITIDTPHDFYIDYIKSESERFAGRRRSYIEDIWITSHESVYDIENKTLRVYSQEDYSKYWEFKLEEGK